MFLPGDILLYDAPAIRFNNIIPRLIRLITGNRVTHVALYLGELRGKHIILDALSDGIYVKDMDDIVSRDDGFKLYGISRLENQSHSGMYLTLAQQYNKSPYGILTILNLLLQHGYGRLFPHRAWKTWFRSEKGYICSEVCQLVVEDVESIKFPKPANLTEPDDYLSYPWIVTKV